MPKREPQKDPNPRNELAKTVVSRLLAYTDEHQQEAFSKAFERFIDRQFEEKQAPSQPETPPTHGLTPMNTTLETPEQIIDSILLTLEAYHDRQMTKLQEIRTGFQELSKERLIAAWIRLQANCADLATTKKLMIQNIMAQLDGGDGPIF